MDFSHFIEIDERDNFVILRLQGKFVGDDETDHLNNVLKSYVKSDKNKVILDFDNVIYFSSLALGIIVKEDFEYSNNNGKLVICNIPQMIENIFVLTKLSSILNLYKTFPEAERALFS